MESSMHTRHTVHGSRHMTYVVLKGCSLYRVGVRVGQQINLFLLQYRDEPSYQGGTPRPNANDDDADDS